MISKEVRGLIYILLLLTPIVIGVGGIFVPPDYHTMHHLATFGYTTHIVTNGTERYDSAVYSIMANGTYIYVTGAGLFPISEYIKYSEVNRTLIHHLEIVPDSEIFWYVDSFAFIPVSSSNISKIRDDVINATIAMQRYDIYSASNLDAYKDDLVYGFHYEITGFSEIYNKTITVIFSCTYRITQRYGDKKLHYTILNSSEASMSIQDNTTKLMMYQVREQVRLAPYLTVVDSGVLTPEYVSMTAFIVLILYFMGLAGVAFDLRAIISVISPKLERELDTAKRFRKILEYDLGTATQTQKGKEVGNEENAEENK